MEYKPWEMTPELTEDRLCILGRMIRDVRNKAVNSYNPPEGDGLWSLGCLIYPFRREDPFLSDSEGRG